MNELELIKLGIKKLLDRSTPVQLFDFKVDTDADKKAVENAFNKWKSEDEKDEDRTVFKYVFRDEYSFNYLGNDFRLYVNGQVELLSLGTGNEIMEGEPEIKVIELSVDKKEPIIVAESQMDEELKKLINKYAYSRNILIMENNKSQNYQATTTSSLDEPNDFQQFIQETIEESLRFIKENKSAEFMSSYLEEKLNTAHLFGYNEAKYKK